jgi:3-methyladenine DNA glycosylase AlkC
MKESFVDVLSVGGKSNSLGRAHEVVEAVLHNETRLEELYQCMFDENSWTRMRAADSLEKVCRVHPEWLKTYIDRLQKDFAGTAQRQSSGILHKYISRWT